jgi:hypothetical protein
MTRLSRPALLVAAVSMFTGFMAGPTAAYAADTTTPLSAAQMSTALKAAATTSSAAGKGGWQATMTLTGVLSASGSYIVDPPHGVAFEQFRVGKDTIAEYAVDGKGTYQNLFDPRSRSAVKMIGRPAVRYVFTPDKSLRLDTYVKDNAPSPAVVLTEDVKHAGTKTVHDDGSADYRLRDQDDTAVTLHVSPAGVLTGAHATADGLNAALAYTYGPQHVTLPSATATISSATLSDAVTYLSMPAIVKDVAHQSAHHARRAAHGHTVKVAALRKTVRHDVAASNSADHLKMIKTKDIRAGVRVYATNPWTHKTVSYTVKASGKKVVVTKK